MLNFQHPRVRYAACNAIGQMATDFAPTFQKKFHDKVRHSQKHRAENFFGPVCYITKVPYFFSQVISTLLETMKDQSNPRVQAHAAAALINFTEDCPKSLLVPHLYNLVQHLHIIMEAKLQEVDCVSLLWNGFCGGVLHFKRPLPAPVDPEGHQTRPGAGGDLHRLRSRHGRGEVCAVLRQVHALAQTHRGVRCEEGAPAAAWQDHRVH